MAAPSAPRIRSGLPDGRSVIDDVNRRLLAPLDEDPRRTAAELARRGGGGGGGPPPAPRGGGGGGGGGGIPPPAIRERIARLEQTGVIRGSRLDVDPAAL